ncbi:hypothetical protein IC220_02710 [Wolbachia endosymbiont of Pentalonia nigronervosa]|uniref:hypothetical protein n=1 Tax=Wolbachia endosymbiont of Pentalonia nigronervosa TaxID=1301914 RepID=UPI00165F26E1|nr:hypothetical protein [Wolbachia endosymbiont of Pentalonia nigronervosa]MBD0391370.1 hypothetical protein [Wolbachia endosymbiont of Pentalonia nigronervosa]
MFEGNSTLIDEQEQKKDDITTIDSMTLENTFKLLKLGSVLSDLDNDLREVKKGKKTIEDHRKYFQTEVYDRLTKLCLIYHPDMVQGQGGSDEEILITTAIQNKIIATRNILKHFNDKFSQEGDFKYSSFSKINVNFFGNEEKVEEITYATLNKIKELYDFKHDNFILNLNGFLRSSQASIKGFIANDFDCFLKEKSNAERYFRNYFNGQCMLFNHLESFHKQCKQDNCMKPIATQMLEECNIQGSILIQIEKFLKQNSRQRRALINRDDAENRLYLSCINNEQSYKKADKDVALAFVEYMNVLVMCNEICNKIMNKEMSWCGWISSSIPGFNHFVSMNYLIGSEVIRKIVADNEITKNSEDVLFLRKISHYLVTYYCYGNEGSRQIAADLLDINFDLLGEEDALQLLVQVIEVYLNYLEKEFRPEKYGRKHQDCKRYRTSYRHCCCRRNAIS